MQPVHRSSLLVALVWLCSTPLPVTCVSTDATNHQPRASLPVQTASVLVSPSARKNPFKGLFAPQRTQDGSRRSAHAPASPKPKVVCGMVIIPADPLLDPRMGVEPPNRDTRFTIRAVQPPVCWPK
jgi:hypothetical protein